MDEMPPGGLLYRLEYELVTDGWELSFESPPTLEWNDPAGAFKVTLEDGQLVVEMNERHQRVEAARGRAEAFLRSWAIKTMLDSPGARVRFEFRDARVSDRETSAWRPPTAVRVSQVGVDVVISKPPPRRTYPPAPVDFVADETVSLMWDAWIFYTARKESLCPMAYYCLTVLENSAGGRRQAARKYAVSIDVLSALGALTTNKQSGRMPGRLAQSQ